MRTNSYSELQKQDALEEHEESVQRDKLDIAGCSA
jgi:hypothetical protein